MTFYKLQVSPTAGEECNIYNEQVEPEIIADHNDPYRVDWIAGKPKEDVFIGEKACYYNYFWLPILYLDFFRS